MTEPVPTARGAARGRMLRFFFMAALVGMLLAVGFWILRDRNRVAGPAGGTPAEPISTRVRDARLSASSQPGAVAAPRFRSGEEIYAHFTLDRPATLFLALLDARLGLSALSPVPGDGVAGANAVGPHEVEDGAGREVVVILASDTPRTRDDFLRLLGRATDAVRGVEAELDARLKAILAALRAHDGLHAEAVEYQHTR